MSNKFFKTSNVSSGLPSRVASSSWDRLKKYAHDIWDISANDDGFDIGRKRDEPTDPVITPADVRGLAEGTHVIMFMGGQKIAGVVVEDSEFNDDVVINVNGEYHTVPVDWVHVAQVSGGPRNLEVRMIGLNKGFILNNIMYRVTAMSPDFITAVDKNNNQVQLHPNTPVMSA